VTTAVLSDGVIDYLGKRRELAEILPGCAAILRAGWRESKGCAGCGKRFKPAGRTMDPNARHRFRKCLCQSTPEAVTRLKALLGVDTLSVYTRLTGQLSVTRL